MARPRKSLAQARLSGAAAKNPQRYRRRVEPTTTGPLGPAPNWLNRQQKMAWREFDRRLPWLNFSHRAIVEIAAILQAKLAAGTLGLPGMQLLRVTLGQLGATPVDAAKIAFAAPDEPDDLLDN
jgi:hypothetical protein